ncbi:MauE/DoxX family redox-associated membrane protein [Paenibacillus chitinolyticus]|uniref:MauE/DoxX family redox-associated membrane protein n=1 Tax=Paenibacillus chitinolyticus TaxID=79263 RepID=UPI003665C1A4
MIQWSGYVLDMTMSVLFFMPFYIKAIRFRNFRIELYSYGILPRSLVSIAALVVLSVEFLLFLSFAVGLLGGWRELAAIVLLAAFAFFSWRKTKLTGVDTCACYGEIAFLNRSPVYRNAILIGLLVVDLLLPAPEQNGYARITSLLFVMALSISIGLLQSAWTKRKRRKHREHSAVSM